MYTDFGVSIPAVRVRYIWEYTIEYLMQLLFQFPQCG